MKKNIVNCLIALILCAVFAASLSVPFALAETKTDELPVKGAVYDLNYTPTKNKAMIFIPGLMASSFFDAETDEQLWGINGFLNLLFKSEGKQVERFTAVANTDDEMVPTQLMKIASMNTGDPYGSFDGMKHGFDVLKPVYEDSYDFIVWQYDWRYTNTFAALKLEEFINKCGYDKVVFVTHSMGGIVVANYLTKPENREKVEVFVPFGAPFLGSFDAINNLFYSEITPEEEENADLVSQLFSLVDLQSIARKLSTPYELLPFEEIRSWDVYDGEFSLYEKGGVSLSVHELDRYIFEQDWAKNKDGQVKSLIATLQEYRDRFFVEKDGKKVFITELVNTEYIVGLGVETYVGAGFNTETGKINARYYCDMGDGTVPGYSATAGLPFDAENVHLVYGVEHGPLANPPVERTGLRYLVDIVSKHIGK